VADPRAEPLPRLSPWLVHRADDLCARRLAEEFADADGSYDPVNRGRSRDAFLAAAREAHAELRVPTEHDFAGAGADLEPEERAVLAQAARWYVLIFGDRAARYVDHALDRPSASPQRRVRVGGWVDLAVVDEHGGRELRQFDLWAGRHPADPLELESVRLAVLRLTKWCEGEPLRVVWADLVHGGSVERVVGDDERAALRLWFDERLARVRERTTAPVAVMGSDCQRCRHVAGCPVVPGAVRVGRPPNALLPGWTTVTPTQLDRWRRCPRDWYLGALQVPASDLDPSPVHGQQVHDLLRFVHEHGSCRDPGSLDDALAAHGWDDNLRLRADVERHVRRCPVDATSLGHERTVVRVHRRPYPPFLAAARLDALWLHDGLFDARDYKTGRVRSERVADDVQARIQAWVLAPLAAELGARLRVSFEHLAAEVDEDPEPFEPDDEDLAAIDEELRKEVEAIWCEHAWTGVGDGETCRRCRYRSICRDSATPGAPTWPRVDAD
jgi:hypothetical protein